MPRRHVVDFAVMGKGPFPLDMLRYDQCWPARQEDVERLNETAMRTVLLRTITENPTHCVTIERWRSFGWMAIERIKA